MAFLRVCANVDANVIYAVDSERALALAQLQWQNSAAGCLSEFQITFWPFSRNANFMLMPCHAQHARTYYAISRLYRMILLHILHIPKVTVTLLE